MSTPTVPALPSSTDPWLSDDDGLGGPHLQGNGSQEDFLAEIARSANEDEESQRSGQRSVIVPDGAEPNWEEEIPNNGQLDPEIITNVPEIAAQLPSQPVAAEEPDVYEYEDGSSIRVEPSNRGLKATFDTGIAGMKKEVFYGKTERELFAAVGRGKLNANIKIRELGQRARQVPAVVEPVASAPVAEPRGLTADEVFQLKTMFTDNPAAAIDHYSKLQTGHTLAQLYAIAKEGRDTARVAKAEVDTESIARAFVADNPEWYSDPDSQNYETVLAWLSRYKLKSPYLGIEITMNDLVDKNLFTVESLQEAYDALTEDGLLLEKPADPTPTPVVAQPQPVAAVPATPVAQPVPSSRIAGTRTGRRAAPANQGLHGADVSAVPALPDANRAPSVEELDNMSEEEIAKLYSGVIALNAHNKARRS